MKKMLAALLILAMCLGMLAGCGEPAKENPETTAPQSGNDQPETPNTDAQEPVEPVDFVIWSEGAAELLKLVDDASETPYWQKVQKETGVNLTFLDNSGKKEAFGLLYASEELPDVMICNPNMFPQGVQGAVDDESLIPLTEFIENGLMPNLKAVLDARPDVDQLVKTDDGEYLYAPALRGEDAVLNFEGLMIRQDWLDELKLEMPENLEDLETVLRAFKEKKGSTGMVFSWGSYSRMMQSFGTMNNFYIGADGKVKYGYITEEYQEFITVFSRWYKDGLIDTDAFTMDRDTYLSKLATGTTGVIEGYIGGDFNAIFPIQEENPGMNWQPVPMLAKKAGADLLFDPSEPIVIAAGGGFISTNCKDPEAAARFLDYFYSEEGSNLISYGIEGESYEIVDGEPQFTDKVINYSEGLAKGLSLYRHTGNRIGVLTGKSQMMEYTTDQQIRAMDLFAYHGDAAAAKLMPATSMTSEETEEYNYLMGDIKTYADEMHLKFILGTESLDKLPEFVETLKEMGIEDAIAIQQAAYDRFMNR